METAEVEAEGAGDVIGASGGGTRGAQGDLDAALTTVERLAVRLDADALVVAGDLDDEEVERVEELAARVRLVLLRLTGGER